MGKVCGEKLLPFERWNTHSVRANVGSSQCIHLIVNESTILNICIYIYIFSSRSLNYSTFIYKDLTHAGRTSPDFVEIFLKSTLAIHKEVLSFCPVLISEFSSPSCCTISSSKHSSKESECGMSDSDLLNSQEPSAGISEKSKREAVAYRLR